jgi:hypothetical protein
MLLDESSVMNGKEIVIGKGIIYMYIYTLEVPIRSAGGIELPDIVISTH